MFCDRGAITVERSNLAGNSAATSGGGIAWSDSAVVLDSNLFSGNNAGYGGGAHAAGGTADLFNNTFVSNTSTDGGGVYHVSGVLTLVNNTLVANMGGIYTTSPSDLGLRNNDVYANNASDYAGIANPTGSAGNISVDPMFVDVSLGDYHLGVGSPLVDKGDDSVVATGSTDLDIEARRQGAHVDIGAYEQIPPGGTLMDDAILALRIAAGLTMSTQPSVDRLLLEAGLPGNSAVTLDAAVCLIRKAVTS